MCREGKFPTNRRCNPLVNSYLKRVNSKNHEKLETKIDTRTQFYLKHTPSCISLSLFVFFHEKSRLQCKLFYIGLLLSISSRDFRIIHTHPNTSVFKDLNRYLELSWESFERIR